MAREILTFRRLVAPADLAGLFLPLQGKVNALPWQGREARTCRVLGVYARYEAGETGMVPATLTVHVRPYPWAVRRVDAARDGTLLDGHGQPLPEAARK